MLNEKKCHMIKNNIFERPLSIEVHKIMSARTHLLLIIINIESLTPGYRYNDSSYNVQYIRMHYYGVHCTLLLPSKHIDNVFLTLSVYVIPQRPTATGDPVHRISAFCQLLPPVIL